MTNKKINVDDYVLAAIRSFTKDRPSTDFQRGYERALKDVRDRK